MVWPFSLTIEIANPGQWLPGAGFQAFETVSKTCQACVPVREMFSSSSSSRSRLASSSAMLAVVDGYLCSTLSSPSASQQVQRSEFKLGPIIQVPSVHL